MSPDPNVVIYPNNYKGALNNLDEKLTLGGYPQLSYNTDSFKAWLAQSASSLGVQAIAVGWNTAKRVLNQKNTQESPVGIAGDALVQAANLVSTVYEHSIMPNQAHGSTGSQTLAALNLLNFYIMQKHITAEFAEIIDNYFSMFGYACHKVKKPNRNVRSEWTYTKTIGCVLHGNIPSDDIVKIASIYNAGITFWRNPANVGNYSLPNQPG